MAIEQLPQSDDAVALMRMQDDLPEALLGDLLAEHATRDTRARLVRRHDVHRKVVSSGRTSAGASRYASSTARSSPSSSCGASDSRVRARVQSRGSGSCPTVHPRYL